MNTYTYEDYSKPNFVDTVIAQGQDNGHCKLILDGNIAIVLPTRMALLNIIFWEPLIQYGIRPTKNELYNIKNITSGSTATIHSHIYDILLDTFPDTYYMEFVEVIFRNIERLENIILANFGPYIPSIDGLGLARLTSGEEMQKILSQKISGKFGTKAAEQHLKSVSKEVIKLLKDPNTPDNIVYPYMQADALKENQIPQMLIAYGPRSDLDDSMQKNVIGESSYSGIKTPEDFATESLSAKKSIYFSRDVIKKSQYFGRKMKLGCSNLTTIYPGSCGSTMTIPFSLREDIAKNFIDKIIVDQGRRVILTSNNISSYVGKTIQMVSPFGCRHTDGVCEYCAGYGKDRLIKYMPPDIHIGLLSSTKTSSTVSQKVLSAKHLISTSSKIYNLPDGATKYFVKDGDCIYWKPEWAKKLTGYSIRIPADAIGAVIDLGLDALPTTETFSKVSYFEMLYEGEFTEMIPLESEVFVPYFSTSTLEYMHNNFNKLKIDDDYIIIPIEGLDFKKPFFNYTILNDDMITYTNRVRQFLSTNIINYTTVPSCLEAFANVIYSKSSINIFFLEMVLRSMLIENDGTYRVPVVEDYNNVTFSKLDDSITESTVCGKLSFERLGAYLSSPMTPITERPAGLFAPYFGLFNPMDEY